MHFTSRLANPFSRPSQVRTQVGWICKVASIVFEVFRVYTRELSQTVSPHHFFLFQAYYRQGVALQCLGRHAEALAAFAAALAQDPKSSQLLAALTEAAMKSPLKGWYSALVVCEGVGFFGHKIENNNNNSSNNNNNNKTLRECECDINYVNLARHFDSIFT